MYVCKMCPSSAFYDIFSLLIIKGMFQRLDKLRKNAFGSMVILGESKNNSIAGLWFWRTQDLAFKVSCASVNTNSILCSLRRSSKFYTLYGYW